MIDSCTSCLRRAFLIAHLAPRIAGLLGGRERRASGLLALPEDDLLAAAAGEGVGHALAFLEKLDTDSERERLTAGGFSVLCAHATAYPPLLRQLTDPPAVLFAAGREETFAVLREEPAVAVVGRGEPVPTAPRWHMRSGAGSAPRACRW